MKVLLILIGVVCAVGWGLTQLDVVSARTWISSDVAGLVGWIGLLVSLVGLKMTYDQATEAKLSAQQATTAAEAAVAATQKAHGQFELVRATYSSAQLPHFLGMLQRGEYGIAQHHYNEIRRTIILKYGVDAEGRIPNPSIQRATKAIADELEASHLDPKSVNVKKLIRAARGLMDNMVDWERNAVDAVSKGTLQ